MDTVSTGRNVPPTMSRAKEFARCWLVSTVWDEVRTTWSRLP